MASQRGGLSPLTIGAIFLVVFALLQGGVQFSNGELLPADTTSDREDSLRDVTWNELNEKRAARDLAPMHRDRFVRGIAQDTTDTIADRASAERPAEDPIGDDRSIPNHRLVCTQVPAAVHVENGTATGDTAAAIADAIETADETNALFRSRSQFRTGIGIAIESDTVYAVFRSCEQVDT